MSCPLLFFLCWNFYPDLVLLYVLHFNVLPVPCNLVWVTFHIKIRETGEVQSETAVRNWESCIGKWRGREEMEDYNKEWWREGGESKDAATGCTRDSLPKGIVYWWKPASSKQRYAMALRHQAQAAVSPLVWLFLLPIYPTKCPLLMWETLLYTSCLWIFNDAFWARTQEMRVRALWDFWVWTSCFSALAFFFFFHSSTFRNDVNQCVALLMYCPLPQNSTRIVSLLIPHATTVSLIMVKEARSNLDFYALTTFCHTGHKYTNKYEWDCLLR